MKRVILFAAACLFLNHPAQAEEPQSKSSVKVRVTSNAKSDYGGKGGKGAKGGRGGKTQERRLDVILTNTGQGAIANLSIRWTMYGRTMKEHDLVKLGSGEIKGELDAAATRTFSSAPVKIEGQRETTIAQGGRGGRGGNGQASVKKIPASGNIYYGYAVMVYDGEQLIASEYSHPSIQQENAP